jgi:hypothetical protein
MGKGTTLLGQLQAQLPWVALARAVDHLGGDHKVHLATCRSHFLVMTLAMLLRQPSLRRIEGSLAGRLRYLAHFGIGSVDRSSVSYANRHRPAEAAEAMYHELLRRCQAAAVRHAFPFHHTVWTLDATVIQVSSVLYEWARCAPDESGIKLHLFLDQAGLLPVIVEFGTLRDSERAMAKRRHYRRGTVLCFDRGYFDSAWFRELTEQGVVFVTRLPANIRITVLTNRKVPPGSGVIADQLIRLSGKIAGPRCSRVLRLVTFADPQRQKTLSFLTNQLTWSALTICQVYKSRWQIELFFKWLKQTLKLSHLYGRTENAVRWQVLTALCLYLLLWHLKQRTARGWTLSELHARLDHYLFDPVTLPELLDESYQFQT